MSLPTLATASLLATLAAAPLAFAQSPRQPNWAEIERETLEHFQAILRLDTRNPPGRETRAAEYLKTVFDKEGIPAELLALDSTRANVVARLTGTGRKRPLLIMGHTDVVTVDTTKWTHPPFAATRDGGYVYGRGAVDDKATATLDVRMLPDEDPERFLSEMKKVVNDTAVEVRFQEPGFNRPTGIESRIDSEAFKAIEAGVRRVYNVPTIPTMSTGATDMAFTRAKGIQCFGFGPALDIEDGPKGFGAHSDQERILESELHRFVRLNWEVVTSLAREGTAPVP